jgi:hypothetical protein
MIVVGLLADIITLKVIFTWPFEQVPKRVYQAQEQKGVQYNFSQQAKISNFFIL